MRVAHIGGFPTITESLIASLRSRGIDAFHLTLQSAIEFLRNCADPNQVLLHLHGLDAYTVCSKIAEERGFAVVLDLSSPLLYCPSQSEKIRTTVVEGTANSALSVLTSNLWYPTVGINDEQFIRKSSVPALVGLIPYHGPTEPSAGRIRVLHIPYNTSSESFAQTREILQGSDLKFDLSIMELSDNTPGETYYNAIKECDLFIEDLTLPFYGPLAVTALATGKTVLGSAPQRIGSPAAALCPVLDTNLESLHRRLSSIVREPRCLRDLGGRSRQFALSHHNNELITNDLIQHYETFMSRTLATENVVSKKGQYAPL